MMPKSMQPFPKSIQSRPSVLQLQLYMIFVINRPGTSGCTALAACKMRNKFEIQITEQNTNFLYQFIKNALKINQNGARKHFIDALGEGSILRPLPGGV